MRIARWFVESLPMDGRGPTATRLQIGRVRGIISSFTPRDWLRRATSNAGLSREVCPLRWARAVMT